MLNSKINMLQIIGMITGILTLAGQMGLAPAAYMSLAVFVLGLIAQKFFTNGTIVGGLIVYVGNILGIIGLTCEYILENNVFPITGMGLVWMGFIINTINLVMRTFFFVPARK